MFKLIVSSKKSQNGAMAITEIFGEMSGQFLVIGLVVTSSFIHALDGVIVKWISNLTATEMTFWRMAIQTIILVPVCHFR